MISLFSSDFIMLVAIGLITMNRHFFLLDLTICRIIALMYYSACTHSFTMLALISLTRYKTIHQKTNPGIPGSVKTAVGNMIISILASIMCAGTGIIYMDLKKNSTVFYGHCIIKFHFSQVQSTYLILKIILCLLWAIAPTGIFSFFYAVFYKTLKNTMIAKQTRTLRLVMLLLLSFLIIQIPYTIAFIIELTLLFPKTFSCQWENRRTILTTFVRFLPHTHCIANPLVYAFSGTEFRKQLKSFIHCHLWNKKQYLLTKQLQHTIKTQSTIERQKSIRCPNEDFNDK